jgi:hypothetical protein
MSYEKVNQKMEHLSIELEDFIKEEFLKKKNNKQLILIFLTILINCYLVFSFIFWSFNPLIWDWYGRLISVLLFSIQVIYYEKKNIL